MPKFTIRQYVEATYIVTFEAENLDEARQLIEDCFDVDDLPDVEKFWRKGQEEFDLKSLAEKEDNE
jgi:hypothetical protein